MAISTLVMGKAPYKNVLVNDLILDKEGKKMSKHVGNTVDPFLMLDKYGADATRWYLMSASPAWSPTKFDEEALVEVVSKFFGTLRNVYNFFVLYSNQDNIDPKTLEVPYEERPELDRWILSKYNNLILTVREGMEAYDHMKTVRAIQYFVAEERSNWYIRRARRRFYAEDLTKDKQSVYLTTYEILVGVTKLMAPFAPFISDEMYIKLTGDFSVHTAFLPEAKTELIDENVQKRMDLVRVLVGLGRGTREKEKIKVRQPLSEIMVDGKYQALIGDLAPLILEELNVKRVVFENDLETFLDFSLKPNFKVAGPVLGGKIKDFAAALAKENPGDLLGRLETEGKVVLSIGGEDFEIEKSFLDIKIQAKEGFAVATENNVFTILETTLDEQLIAEGLARELISKVQQLRKQMNFEMMDRIKIYVDMNETVAKAVAEFKDYICKETLAVDILEKKDVSAYDLNGHKTGIEVERV